MKLKLNVKEQTTVDKLSNPSVGDIFSEHYTYFVHVVKVTDKISLGQIDS